MLNLVKLTQINDRLHFVEFITVCWKDGKPYQAIYSVQGEAEILNPTLEGIYPVIKDVLQEYKDVFPDEFIHLGMDEVYYECWLVATHFE